MTDFFNTLLSLSFSGSIVAITLLIIRIFGKDRLSKSWQYYIWLVVLLRITLPVTFNLNIVDSLFQKPGEFTPQFNIHLLLRTNIGVEVGLSRNLWILWGCGFFIMITMRFYQLYIFNKTIKTNSTLVADKTILNVFNQCLLEMKIERNIAVYKSDFVMTPMLVGIINPIILLPVWLSNENELHYVFIHELVHYKRKDLWYKWFVQFLLCTHWFNPFIHFIAHRIDRDCELSCDEAVIGNLDIQEIKEYGATIIEIANLSRGPVEILAATMCDEKKIIKERLRAIKKYKKTSNLAPILKAIILIIILTISSVMGALVT